jgi:hypothetical protein
MIAAERQPAAADLDQARGAGAKHLHPAADPDAQFAQPAHPGGLAGNVAYLRPLTRAEAFQRQEEIDAHKTPTEGGKHRQAC